MHSGMLDRTDIDRLGVNIRDWVTEYLGDSAENAVELSFTETGLE